MNIELNENDVLRLREAVESSIIRKEAEIRSLQRMLEMLAEPTPTTSDPPVAAPKQGAANKKPGFKRKPGSTHDRVLAALEDGSLRPGAVCAALGGKPSIAAIQQMLRFLVDHGEVRRNDDGTYEALKQ